MDMKITQAAKNELDKIQADDKYLRIALSKSGCCSYAFTFYADTQKSQDEFVEAEGYKFLISERAKLLLESAKTLDYGRHGVFRDFKIVMK